MNANSLSATEQQQFLQMVEDQQKKEFSTSIVQWTEKCFSNCCSDFTSKTLSNKETKCIKSCFMKQTDATKRMGMRFAEENVLFNE
jgi:mitochondrial import inner membrane translocase subunit TIM9